MRRIIAVCVALLGGIAGTQADQPVMKYYDLIRSHGRPRSDAIHQADINYCYDQTGAEHAQVPTVALLDQPEQ